MKIYFLGICGTAMGNTALMLRSQGHTVMGADTSIYPPMSTVLQAHGIGILEGYDADRLLSINPDLVVVGNVISRGNPEIEMLLETKVFPYTSLPALLFETVLKNRKNIVITGTHGKTSTTNLSTFLLKSNKKQPGYILGGLSKDLPNSACLGNPQDPFVIEGDEYDTAFFDKRSKFIHYNPHIAVINNIEFDHADIFDNLQSVIRTFQHFTRLIPRNGYLLMNGDDYNCLKLLPIPWTSVLKVGLGQDNDLILSEFKEYKDGASFKLYYKNKFWTRVDYPLNGLFNARNTAMAALATALFLYPEDPCKLDLSCLKNIKGVKRRQEILLERPNCIIMEDFAHHPSAIEETLRSLKTKYPNHYLSVCFEASSNTSRSSIFQKEFTQSLSLANSVFIAPILKQVLNPLDTQAMADTLIQEGLISHAFDCHKSLIKNLHTHIHYINHRPHLICFLSNGSFGGVISEFVSLF